MDENNYPFLLHIIYICAFIAITASWGFCDIQDRLKGKVNYSKLITWLALGYFFYSLVEVMRLIGGS